MKVVITAGPTREWMDPVRYLSNPSSGAMGIAIAEILSRRYDVRLILGPTHLAPSKKIKTVRVSTALEMEAAVRKNLRPADTFIATAAVGDWRFARVARSKLKKSNASSMMVKLVKNPDILASAKAAVKIGFALESDDLKKNAVDKLKWKNLDLIIANAPASFSSSRIKPMLIERSGRVTSYPTMSKKALARKIAQWLERRWKPAN